MKLFLLKSLLPLALFACLMAGKCSTDGCVTEATQCKGTAVEVCNSEGNWDEIMDCAAVSEDSPNNYVCCFDESDGTYSCLADDQCGTPPSVETDGS